MARKLRLISWNVAGRVTRLDEQLAALKDLSPDIIALQEIRSSTVDRFREGLRRIGLTHFRDSLKHLPSHSNSKRRAYWEIVACRWPMRVLSPLEIAWKERVLSVIAYTDNWGPIELHTTHVPCGSVKPYWRKIETLKGIHKRLAYKSKHHRILCGDFNMPQIELPDGRIVTWGQYLQDSEIITSNDEWDDGERGVLEGLKEYDLSDVYRALYGYKVEDFSWVLRRYGKAIAKRRFDHVYASAALNPVECQYVHSLREKGLSDHSPILVVFQPR